MENDVTELKWQSCEAKSQAAEIGVSSSALRRAEPIPTFDPFLAF